MLNSIQARETLSDAFLFKLFAVLVIVFAGLSVILYDPLPLLVPTGMAFVLFVVLQPRTLFYLFFLLLPFSVETELPGGFGTDLPSEPLMLVLTGICILFFLLKAKDRQSSIFKNPISLFIVLHLCWLAFVSIYSTNQLFSFKFLLAKIWYILPFYFLPLLILREEREYSKVFKYLATGLFISVMYVMLRHAGMGFSFDTINEAVRPIYRNHVNYGILLVAFLPYCLYLIRRNKNKVGLFSYAGLAFLLLAIYLTYTRAAHLSVVIALAVYFIIRWRLARYAVMVAGIAAVSLVTYLAIDNNYLDYAPEYTKAIEHKKFDNLVEATYKMEDISTVERFYRWVAGVNMIKERPFHGFGPSSFYSNYKQYTVNSYKTYVSDNPEKSGIHNYYLMTAVEQGVPGLLIFVLLSMLCILYGEKAYHKMVNPQERSLIMAAVTSFIIILAVLIINDLLEADKVGPIFFLNASIIAFYCSRAKEIQDPAPKRR